MAYQPTQLLLDDAVLTDATIAAAGGGLPRRIVVGNSPFARAVLALAPTHFYKMDELSGAVLTDSSGNGRNGTIQTSYVTLGNAGKEGACFTGTNANAATCYLPTGANGFEPAFGSAFTISFWFYGIPSGTVCAFFGHETLTAGQGIRMYYSGGGTVFYVRGAGGDVQTYLSVPFSSSLTSGWNHIAVTVGALGTSSTYKVFHNGVSVGFGATGNCTSITYSAKFEVGRWWQVGGMPIGSKMDMFTLFNYALTETQVLEVTTGGHGSASWTVPQATGVPKMVCVPGALGQTTTTQPTTVSLSVDGGVTPVAVEPDIDLGTLTPTGDTVLDVELTDNTTFIGGAAGEGPTLWVDDGITPSIPPTNRRDWNPINRGMV